jgi:hypothetical protein
VDTAEILKKLRCQCNLKSVVWNAPEPMEEDHNKLGYAITLTGKSQFTVLYVKDKHDAAINVTTTTDCVEYDGIAWIAYPKGTSSMRTYISRDKLWDLLKPYGYKPVSMIAIDNSWSATRIKPTEKVKSK